MIPAVVSRALAALPPERAADWLTLHDALAAAIVGDPRQPLYWLRVSAASRYLIRELQGQRGRTH